MKRERSSVCEHRLELSTGVVVGFCYHKAADLRVRQAAHSLPCLSLVFSLALHCCLFINIGQTVCSRLQKRLSNCPPRSVESNIILAKAVAMRVMINATGCLAPVLDRNRMNTNTQAPFPTDRFGVRSRHSHTSIARWALSSLHYRIATFALQRTFRFTPLGLAFCFFPF